MFALEVLFHYQMLLGAVFTFFCHAGWREDFGTGQRTFGWNFNIVPML